MEQEHIIDAEIDNKETNACRICGRAIGKSLLSIHEKQCSKKRSSKRLLPNNTTGTNKSGSTTAEDAPVGVTAKCKNCSQIFSEELFALHQRTCNGQRERHGKKKGRRHIKQHHVTQVHNPARSIVLQTNRLAEVTQSLPTPQYSWDSEYIRLSSKYNAIISNQKKLETKLEHLLSQYNGDDAVNTSSDNTKQSNTLENGDSLCQFMEEMRLKEASRKPIKPAIRSAENSSRPVPVGGYRPVKSNPTSRIPITATLPSIYCKKFEGQSSSRIPIHTKSDIGKLVCIV